MEKGMEVRDKEISRLNEALSLTLAMKKEADVILADQLHKAEQSARRSESELATKAKVCQSEVCYNSALEEIRAIKSNVETVHQVAYESLSNAEEEVRALRSELKKKTSKIHSLTLVNRSKERELSRVKLEKDTSRTAENERARAAEEVAISIEVELQSMRVKNAKLEGLMKERDGELSRLESYLMQSQGDQDPESVMSQNQRLLLRS